MLIAAAARCVYLRVRLPVGLGGSPGIGSCTGPATHGYKCKLLDQFGFSQICPHFLRQMPFGRKLFVLK